MVRLLNPVFVYRLRFKFAMLTASRLRIVGRLSFDGFRTVSEVEPWVWSFVLIP
jgi:hypothetical protein